MARKPITPEKAKAASSRDDRLKAALKANMARRKAQSRARTAGDTEPGDKGNEDERQN